MTSYADKFLIVDSGGFTTNSSDYDTTYVQLIRAAQVKRIYEASNDGSLEAKLVEGQKQIFRKLSRTDKLAIYHYFRDEAMLNKLVGDYERWNMFLEIADFFRREFKLKVR